MNTDIGGEEMNTDFGFVWGPLEVRRLCSDHRAGFVLEVRTGKGAVEIRVTPKGSIRIYPVLSSKRSRKTAQTSAYNRIKR